MTFQYQFLLCLTQLNMEVEMVPPFYLFIYNMAVGLNSQPARFVLSKNGFMFEGNILHI